MKYKTIKYEITPRILKADSMQTITVRGLDESSRFYDDEVYYVTFSPMESFGLQRDENNYLYKPSLEEYEVKAHDGVLKIEHYFEGEQEWVIRIFAKENEKHLLEHVKKMRNLWKWLVEGGLIKIEFRAYSLYEDLYNKRPFKGDLHIHTTESDGEESPEMTAARYRWAGYDFISITDHFTMNGSLRAIEKFKGIKTPFKIFPGEEVHDSMKAPFYHVVSLNAKKCITDILLNERERVGHEIEEIAGALEVPPDCDKYELAWRVWINNAIHEAGGVTIFVHPYWTPYSSYQIQTKNCEEILKRGLADVFEVVGGLASTSNEMQSSLYNEMRANGIDIPVVASTDAHSARCKHLKEQENYNWFGTAMTLVFAESAEHIQDSILNKYTVAVNNITPDDKKLIGSFRMIKYGRFLIDNYYGIHDEYCSAIGQVMLAYIFGDKSQNDLIFALEENLRKFNDSFFGTKQ